MMRRLIIVVAFVAAVGAALAGFTVYRGVYVPAESGGAEPAPEMFTVRAGESFGSVAGRLADLGFVTKPRTVRAYAWLRRVDRRIKVGTYRISREESPRDILEKLVEGDVYRVSVTIPEGFVKLISRARAVARLTSSAISSITGIVRIAFANPPGPVVSCPIRPCLREISSS